MNTSIKLITLICFCFSISCTRKKNIEKQELVFEHKIVEFGVYRFADNSNKVEFNNEFLHLKLIETDTIWGLKKIMISANGLVLNGFIYHGYVLEKNYADRETILLSNLDTSFLFGKNKLVPGTGVFTKSVLSTKEKYDKSAREVRDYSSGWRKINFFRTSRFVDTYEINFLLKQTISDYHFCTVRFRDKNNRLFLETIQLTR